MPDLEPALVTIPHVPLIDTGTWEASTGEVTFTLSDLQSSVAALEDPAIKQPRARFGHWKGAKLTQSQGGMASQPIAGKFCNLSVEGQTIYADLVGVPAWLAKILPTAYPNRSVEAYFDVTTPTGKKHQMVLASVALLGEELPAVATLEDLNILFSEDGPEWVQDLEVHGDAVAASRGGSMPSTQVAASVDTADVRTAFYDQIATEDSGRYWWWLTQVYIDPTVVIADDEDGEYWLVPYSMKGNAVEFGDPVQVYIQWVNQDSGKVEASASVELPEQYGQPDAVYASAASSRPANRQREHITKKEARASMPIDTSLLTKRLGLPEDASEEQINEALAAEAQPEETPEPETPETPEADEAPEPKETPEEEVETPEAVAAAGGVVVDKTAWEENQKYVSAQRKRERDDFIHAAVTSGKIPPSRKSHYVALMEQDEKGTREFIDKLEEGAVPVKEIGSAAEAPDDRFAGQGTGLLPELQEA